MPPSQGGDRRFEPGHPLKMDKLTIALSGVLVLIVIGTVIFVGSLATGKPSGNSAKEESSLDVLSVQSKASSSPSSANFNVPKPTRTPVPSATPKPSPTPAPTPSPTPSQESSPTPEPSPTPTSTPSLEPSPTPAVAE